MTIQHNAVGIVPSGLTELRAIELMLAANLRHAGSNGLGTARRAHAAAAWPADQLLRKTLNRAASPIVAGLKVTALVVFLTLSLVFTTALFTSQPAAARQVCGDRSSVLKQLSGRYSETPQAMGLSVQGTVVEVLVAATGSWTILVGYPNGRSCVAASGDHWETLPMRAAGPAA